MVTRAKTCPRCGHGVRHSPGTLAHLARVVGRKRRRIECRAPTDLGWACPCRSRFHSR